MLFQLLPLREIHYSLSERSPQIFVCSVEINGRIRYRIRCRKRLFDMMPTSYPKPSAIFRLEKNVNIIIANFRKKWWTRLDIILNERILCKCLWEFGVIKNKSNIYSRGGGAVTCIICYIASAALMVVFYEYIKITE